MATSPTPRWVESSLELHGPNVQTHAVTVAFPFQHSTEMALLHALSTLGG